MVIVGSHSFEEETPGFNFSPFVSPDNAVCIRVLFVHVSVPFANLG